MPEKLKHEFVPILDVSERLPFTINLVCDVKKDLNCQEKAKIALDTFIKSLEKEMKEQLVYIGMDVIGEKYYERFLLEKGGFLEIMMEAPVAINAHFCHQKRAKEFEKAIKSVLSKMLKKDPISKMFIDNIKAASESDENIKVETWDKLKSIRKNV